MHVRIKAAALFLVAAAAGFSLPENSFSGDSGRLLVTFFGLIAASVLPTISLILGNMTASGRSVKALDDLQRELRSGMDALFALFGIVALSVAGLLILSIPEPKPFVHIPYLTTVFDRVMQGLVAGGVILIVLRSGRIPGILRRSLDIRHRIAVEEARRKTMERAPTPDSVREVFSNHPEFGKTINLADIEKRDVS